MPASLLLLFAIGLASAPDPAAPPAAQTGPVRAPRGPADVETLFSGIGGKNQLAGQLASDGRMACWLAGMYSDAQQVTCAVLPRGKPFVVATAGGKVDLVLSGGTLTWTESPFPRPGLLRRAHVDARGAGPVETLAQGLDDPHAVAVAGGDVYWVENPGGGLVGATLHRLGPDGKPLALAKSMETCAFSSLALGPTDAYLGSADALFVVPRSGGTPKKLVAGQQADEVVLAGDHLYWTSGTGTPHKGSIWRAPLAGGPPEELAQHQTYPAFLSVGGGEVYWTDPFASAILRVAQGGGPVELVAGKQFVHGMRLAGDRLLWIAQEDGVLGVIQKLRTCAIPEATPTLAAPEPGPACRCGRCATIVASGLEEPSGLAVAAPWVYWTDARTGSLFRARTAGGAPETVLTGEDQPGGLVTADGAIFWADAGSGLVRSLPLACAHAGCVPRTVAKAEGRPYALIASCDALYWAEEARDESRGRVEKLTFRTGALATLSDLAPLALAVDGGWVYLLLRGLAVAEDEYTQVFRIPADGGPAQSLVGYHHTSMLHILPAPAYAPGGLPRIHLPGWILPVAFGARDGRLYWMEETGIIRWLDPMTSAGGTFGGGPEEPADVPARGGIPAGVRLAVAERVGTFLWAEGRLYWASSYAGDVPVGAIYSRTGGGRIEQVADGHASALAAGDGALFYLGVSGDVVRVNPP